MLEPVKSAEYWSWRSWALEDNISIEKQIEHWLKLVAEESKKNGRVRENDHCQMEKNGAIILMRCYTNDVPGLCLVIGTVNLEASLQNQGWFKAFLKYCCQINPWNDVAIEDVKNEHLLDFCKKHQFISVSERYKDSFIVNKQAILAMETKPFNF